MCVIKGRKIKRSNKKVNMNLQNNNNKAIIITFPIITNQTNNIMKNA